MSVKVSCIVPIYNAEKYLNQAIDSILSQTYINIEIILVNDASSDKTHEICTEYSSKHPEKVIYINRKTNGGSSAAAQDGIIHSSGEIIAFLDSDDMFANKRIETGLQQLNDNKDIDIVVCDYETIDAESNKTGRHTSVPSNINNDNVLNYELKRNYIVRGLLMLRKTDDAFYDVNLRNSDDYDFFLNLVYNGHKVLFTKDILLLYRIHGSNKSSQYHKAKEATKYILNKYKFSDLYKKLSSNGLNNAKIYNTFGIMSILKEDYLAADMYLTNAQDENITDTYDIFENRFYHATVYYKIKNYKDAEICLLSILNYNDASTYNNLGILYSIKGEFIQATEMLHKALKLEPLYMDANNNIAKLKMGFVADNYTERILRKNLVHI